MITVPQPRVLDGNLQEVRRLRPLAASISLTAQGTGEATLTLAAADPRPAMHQWVELFTQHGSAGLYRVTGISNTYTGETQITLRHGIDTLSDSVYPVQAEEATLTVQQLLVNILSYQTARVAGGMPWQLGTCEDATSVKRAFNYDNLASLLQGLEEEKQNFYFTYDFSTTPWTLNFVRKPQDVRCEFRLTRNIEGVTVTLDDSELCTQLLLSINVLTTTTPTSTVDPDVDWPTITANDSAVRTYDNAAAQAEWGIVQKTASIDTQDDIIGQEFPSADAWAARFMADHSQPTLQIQITGEDLSELTGDTFDELALAALCRVALPDHDALFSERVVTVTYPDVYGAPTSVTVSLANRLPRFSSSIAQAQKEAARAESTAKTARRSAGGGGGGTAKELESWAMIVKKTKESADVTGLTELSETGIILDAETGAKIYSLTQGFVSQYAELNVQSGQISTLVQTTDGLDSRITQTATQIQTEVTNRQNADDTLQSQITQTADQIALKVSKGDVATQLSVECGNVTVSGGNLVVDGYVLASGLETAIANIGTVRVSNLQASGNVTVSGGVTASGLYISGGQGAATSVGNAIASIGTATESGGQISIPTTRLDGSQGTPINFNIAATKKYKDDVAAVTLKTTNGLVPTEGTYYPSQGAVLSTITANLTNDNSPSRAVLIPVTGIPSYTQVTVTPIDSPRYFKSDSIAPISTAHVPVKVTGTTRGDARYFKSDSIAPIGTAHVPVKKTGTLLGSPVSVIEYTKPHTGYLRGDTVTGTNQGDKWNSSTYPLYYKYNGGYHSISTTLYYAGKTYTHYVGNGGSVTYYGDSESHTYYNAGGSFTYYDVGAASTLYEAGTTVTRYELLNSSEGATNTYYTSGSAFEYYDVGSNSTLYEAGATLTRYEMLNSSEGATNTYYTAGTAKTYYEEVQPEPDPEQEEEATP